MTTGGINPTVVADFNGDGKNDLAGLTLNSSGTAIVGVGVQLGNGDGSFQPAINTFLSDAVSTFAVGDFDRDSLSDLAVITAVISRCPVRRGTGRRRL